jgi:Hypervirulence associated proteins TUDOR domain
VHPPSLECTSQIQLYPCERSNLLNWVAQLRVGEDEMENRFKVGDHVTWNSEAGHVSGRIIKVHSKGDYKGHTHHASEDEPQYEIKSDKTDHIAMHKGSALKKLRAK